jgi:hypothetical protein
LATVIFQPKHVTSSRKHGRKAGFRTIAYVSFQMSNNPREVSDIPLKLFPSAHFYAVCLPRKLFAILFCRFCAARQLQLRPELLPVNGHSDGNRNHYEQSGRNQLPHHVHREIRARNAGQSDSRAEHEFSFRGLGGRLLRQRGLHRYYGRRYCRLGHV